MLLKPSDCSLYLVLVLSERINEPAGDIVTFVFVDAYLNSLRLTTTVTIPVSGKTLVGIWIPVNKSPTLRPCGTFVVAVATFPEITTRSIFTLDE